MQHERYGLRWTRHRKLARVKAWWMAAGIVGDREALFGLSKRSSVENSIAVFIVEGKDGIVARRKILECCLYRALLRL